MSHCAIQTNAYWSSVEGRSRVYPTRNILGQKTRICSHKRTLAAEMAFLGVIITCLQILDGILTGVGMARLGVDMEGNPLLRALMQHLGYVPALVLMKALAISVVAGLCVYAWRINWLKYALKLVIFMYVVMAIIPWMLILGMQCTA